MNVASYCVVPRINFTRSGYLEYREGKFFIGYEGLWWARTAELSQTSSYYFRLRSIEFYPAYSDPRPYGFTARCLSL